MTDHGSWRGYRRDKCRCPACRAWKAAEWQRYRRRLAGRGVTRPNGWDRYNAAHPDRAAAS